MYSPLGGRRDMLAAAGGVSWYLTGMLMFGFQVLGFGGVPSRYLRGVATVAWRKLWPLVSAVNPAGSG